MVVPNDRRRSESFEVPIDPNQNGSAPNTPPTSRSGKAKKMRLLVDINISPGGTSKVVNFATHNLNTQSKPSQVLQAVSKCGMALLWMSHCIKVYLESFCSASENMKLQPTHGPHNHNIDNRVMISPLRRVPVYRRISIYINFSIFRRIFGKPEEPLRLMEDVKLPAITKGSNGTVPKVVPRKSLEKRKRRESESMSDEENEVMADALECGDDQVISPSGVVEIESICSDNDNDFHDTNNDENVVVEDIPETDTAGPSIDVQPLPQTEQSDSDAFCSPEEGGFCNSTSELNKILDDQDDYESDKDPDYQPPNVDNLSSTDDDEEEDEIETPEELQEEIKLLREEAANDIPALN